MRSHFWLPPVGRGYLFCMKSKLFKSNSLRNLSIVHPVCNVSFSVDMSARGPRIVSLHLNGEPGKMDDSASDPILRRVKDVITGFLDGKIEDLSDLRIDLSRYPPFTRKVLLAARTIPWGRTLSYAGLAKKAGSPGAARAAASAMRNNPLPLIIPCHRVIRSDGSIGGFMGKTHGKEIELKIRLLEREHD